MYRGEEERGGGQPPKIYRGEEERGGGQPPKMDRGKEGKGWGVNLQKCTGAKRERGVGAKYW